LGLHLRRNVSRRGASGWGGIVGRCRRVGSGGRILTVGSEGSFVQIKPKTILAYSLPLLSEPEIPTKQLVHYLQSKSAFFSPKNSPPTEGFSDKLLVWNSKKTSTRTCH